MAQMQPADTGADGNHPIYSMFGVFNRSPNGTETEPIAACRELPKSLTLSADEIIREPS